MTKSYKDRPPSRAKAARSAWDYFRHKYPHFKIQQIDYIAGYRGEPNGWVAERDVSDPSEPLPPTYLLSRWQQKFATCDQIKRSGF